MQCDGERESKMGIAVETRMLKPYISRQIESSLMSMATHMLFTVHI